MIASGRRALHGRFGAALLGNGRRRVHRIFSLFQGREGDGRNLLGNLLASLLREPRFDHGHTHG